MLAVEHVDTYYGKSHVLFDVSLSAAADEVVAVLGRNGAGKTTLLRSVMGLTPPRAGRIVLDGEDVTGASPSTVANRGVGYVPQDRRLFPALTVRENLQMGAGTGPWDPDRVARLLDQFPQLDGRLDQRAGSLSGGEQQMVAMARALVRNPKLVLLDEPTEGLMPALVSEVGDAVRDLAGEGYTIVLVEQHVDLALDLADRVYLLENGRVRAESTPAELRADESLLERHLGV
ncbi:MAG: ABC transporter ATP-binding protein [Haloarculaceae archaeon]